MPNITMVDALNEALRQSLREDDRVMIMGEDIGQLGGSFRVTEGLVAEFGDSRVIDTPLAESGIVGTAIGLALYGFRPVVEIQFDGFVYSALDQIISHCAKYRFRTRGALCLPLVVRIPFGGGIGAVEHHSESPEAYFAHTAGLKVVAPATPLDAFGLLRAAIRDPDPVIFLEPKSCYWGRQKADLEAAPTELGKARVAVEGTDVTIVAYGPTVKVALEAATLAADEGVSCEVIDLRALSPLDGVTLCESAARTGRTVVVHEASVTGGMGAEIASRIMESSFFSLRAPVVRVGGYDVPYPPARNEEAFLPSATRVLNAVHQVWEA